MQEIKHTATSIIMDPLMGPIHVMIFHVATMDAAENFSAVSHMGDVTVPSLDFNPNIKFVRMVYLNGCYTERDVLEALGLPLSPIQEIVSLSVGEGTSDTEIAVAFDRLQSGAVYLHQGRRYKIDGQIGDYVYKVHSLKGGKKLSIKKTLKTEEN